jgi:dTDP-4-dehydrorhamnose reductase
MRVVVTGARGMLGTEVCGAAESDGFEVLAWGRSELDVLDRVSVASKLKRAAPDAVINCAAFTDVDRAQAAQRRALAVNGVGAGNVARAAAAVDAWMIHISSDYVFDGRKREPYLESDGPAPLSAYGHSKLAGERAVARLAPSAHTIVRTAWLFGRAGRCFPATILRLAAERDQLTVVDDQIGAPTFTGHLARALVELAPARLPGIVHVAGDGECSWFEFAHAVLAQARVQAEIRPGSTRELERPAPRPAYSVLRSERREAPRLPHWRQGLGDFLAAGVASGCGY